MRNQTSLSASLGVSLFLVSVSSWSAASPVNQPVGQSQVSPAKAEVPPVQSARATPEMVAQGIQQFQNTDFESRFRSQCPDELAPFLAAREVYNTIGKLNTVNAREANRKAFELEKLCKASAKTPAAVQACTAARVTAQAKAHEVLVGNLLAGDANYAPWLDVVQRCMLHAPPVFKAPPVPQQALPAWVHIPSKAHAAHAAPAAEKSTVMGVAVPAWMSYEAAKSALLSIQIPGWLRLPSW